MKKVFLNKGDYVKFVHDINYVPAKMVVTGINKKNIVIKEEGTNKIENIISNLKDVTCQWFDKNGALCEGKFNTKDLIKI